MFADFRYALRQISRAPLFAGVIIVVLGLGIGINAGLFTIVHTFVWRPAPGIDPDPQLVRIEARSPTLRGNASPGQLLSAPRRGATFDQLSRTDVDELRSLSGVFDGVSAWRMAGSGGGALIADLGHGPESVQSMFVSDDYFRVLGLRMALGRGFPETGDRAAVPVAVIGHRIWLWAFGGDSSVIGRTIRIAGASFTIVGVAPRHFRGVNASNMGRADLWIPIGARALADPLRPVDPGDAEYAAVGRLAAGVRPEDVTEATAGVVARIRADDPAHRSSVRIEAHRLTGHDSADEPKEFAFAFLLLGVLVVAITCTNASALLLGRAVSRRRELGIRLSLGATRRRIVRQLLTESLVLAMSGAAFGVLLYIVAARVAYATIPELIFGLAPSPETIFVAPLFAIVVTLAFGLIPALHVSRERLAEVIKSGGSVSVGRSRLQRTMIVVQLACSQPVLVVTALVLADIRHDLGVSGARAPADVLTVSLGLSSDAADGSTAQATQRALTRLDAAQRRIAAVGGVRAVALIEGDGSTALSIDARGPDVWASRQWVTPDYFAVMGVPVISGRPFISDENRPASSSIVLNAEAARALSADGAVVGKRIHRRADRLPDGQTAADVLGVVDRSVYEDTDPTRVVFLPMASMTTRPSRPQLLVRTHGDARALVPTIRAAVAEIDPALALNWPRTLAEVAAGRHREARQVGVSTLAVGLLALALASVGLYGTIAFAVAQRAREIGIRLAVGARPVDVVRHFFAGGMRMTAVGLVIGVPVTIAGIKLVEASVLGFTVESVVTVSLVVPALIAVAALASWLPARQAARVDPVVTLRTE